MALLARLREICHHVIRICGALVILQVARHAGGIGQVVVVVHVTVGALPRRDSVQSGQWKAGGRVIESGVGPRRRVVTSGAGRGNTRLRVVGVGGPLIIL